MAQAAGRECCCPGSGALEPGIVPGFLQSAANVQPVEERGGRRGKQAPRQAAQWCPINGELHQRHIKDWGVGQIAKKQIEWNRTEQLLLERRHKIVCKHYQSVYGSQLHTRGIYIIQANCFNLICSLPFIFSVLLRFSRSGCTFTFAPVQNAVLAK